MPELQFDNELFTTHLNSTLPTAQVMSAVRSYLVIFLISYNYFSPGSVLRTTTLPALRQQGRESRVEIITCVNLKYNLAAGYFTIPITPRITRFRECRIHGLFTIPFLNITAVAAVSTKTAILHDVSAASKTE